MYDLHKTIFFCSLIASLAVLKLHFECFSSELVCLKPRAGYETREDNTERYHKLMQEIQPGLDIVCMEGSEKEPVPEFQSLAKCDRRNDQVGDAREGG